MNFFYNKLYQIFLNQTGKKTESRFKHKYRIIFCPAFNLSIATKQLGLTNHRTVKLGLKMKYLSDYAKIRQIIADTMQERDTMLSVRLADIEQKINDTNFAGINQINL